MQDLSFTVSPHVVGISVQFVQGRPERFPRIDLPVPYTCLERTVFLIP